MAKLLAAAGQQAPEVKYIFELNPEHALVKQMADEADEQIFGRWVEMLLGQAMLAERGAMDDPSQFLSAVNQLLTKANCVDIHNRFNCYQARLLCWACFFIPK